MKNTSFKKRVLKSLLFYNVLFVIVTVIFCSVIPKLLIYPPNSINTEFERHIDDGYKYDNQCAVIILFAMLISNILFLYELRKIKGWEQYVNKEIKTQEDAIKLKKIKINCHKIPSKLYILHAFVPPIAAAIGLIATRYQIYFDY
ncbi:MAG: hypothetical protein IJ220_05500 [Clostridia bacterium]|nr:hypothetical protein [Clostridia bacterium]